MIDLHAHSNASDGTDAPAALVHKAAVAGLTAVALTDHDTVEGLPEAGEAAAETGVRLVPGCELSCEVARGTMHLVVLFLDGRDGPLQNRLGVLRAGRDDRNVHIVEALQVHGLEVALDEVSAKAGAGSVGRPHVAAVLVDKGYVSSIDEGFERWLARGRPAYVERERLGAGEAVELVHASGAVAVLAHPFSLDRSADELGVLLGELAEAGLDGMEVEYGRYAPDERAALLDLARRYRLCPSGGSDYHGAYKPDLALGTGRGDLHVPGEWLDALEARRRGEVSHRGK